MDKIHIPLWKTSGAQFHFRLEKQSGSSMK